jgi:uncharacterized Zn finger protein
MNIWIIEKNFKFERGRIFIPITKSTENIKKGDVVIIRREKIFIGDIDIKTENELRSNRAIEISKEDVPIWLREMSLGKTTDKKIREFIQMKKQEDKLRNMNIEIDKELLG